MSTDIAATLPVTTPIISARITQVAEKNHRPGVIGLRGAPVWEEDAFTHAGVPVTVAPCDSTLAVWEALQNRADDQWLVILTPLDDKQLGDGVLAHLVDGRLLSPDPWAALRARFSASALEPGLYRGDDARDLAVGLLTAVSGAAITPAPGGVLTADHAFAAVARAGLGFPGETAVIDLLAIQEWTRQGDTAGAIDRLRARAGDQVTDAVLAWLVQRSGKIAAIVEPLAREGRLDDLVPAGLIAGLLREDGAGVDLGRGMFKRDYRIPMDLNLLGTWYRVTSSMIGATLAPDARAAVIAEAEALLSALELGSLAIRSEDLPSGLRARLRAVAEAIAAVLPSPATGRGADTSPAALRAVHDTWYAAGQHTLAGQDRDYAIFEAAVRLLGWWTGPRPEPPVAMTDAVDSYVTDLAWVDAAITTVRRGTDDAGTSEVLGRLLTVVGERRRGEDRHFAARLAAHQGGGALGVEDLLAQVVLPLAKTTPTLLLVVDGLSMSAATQIAAEAAADGWGEGTVLGAHGRIGALAVLPSLTGRSRTSLLVGQLHEGDAGDETAGFRDIVKGAGLWSRPGSQAPIFHKKDLDALVAGRALATEVAEAIGDTEGRRLVAAVLNYVDDTLHHTDPGGTDWSIHTITHLHALLRAAYQAGRAVIITSDHGHVIERGSTLHSGHTVYGQRAHADLDSVDDGEVLISGPRVLTAGNAAVLAVDEDIRYGARSAGYHGGAAPAEVVVPVLALYPAARPEQLGALGEVRPSWWRKPTDGGETPVSGGAPGTDLTDATGAGAAAGKKPAAKKPAPKTPARDEPGLFDAPAAEVAAEPAPPAPAGGAGLAAQVVRSAVFTAQYGTGRRMVTAEAIEQLLAALLTAPAKELPESDVAGILGVMPHQISGALAQIKSVLDIDGYQVIERLPGAVAIDEALLKEQFGVG